MEREDSEFKKHKDLQRISEDDQERAKLVTEIALNFEREYLEVIAGSKKRAQLYAGDFAAKKEPLSLILPNEKEILITAEYDYIANKFARMIKEDLKHEANTEPITRYPEPKTSKLKDFIKENPGKSISVIHTDVKLKSDQKNSILILAIDRYLYPKDAKTPMSEIWTLRRMEVDTDGSGDSDFSKRAKIMPRSMVRTGSLPALPSGK